MSEDRVITLVKELVKTYLTLKSEVDRMKSELLSSIFDVLDTINFRRIIREVLQEDEHK